MELYTSRLHHLLFADDIHMIVNPLPDGMKNKLILLVTSQSDMEVVAAKIPQDLRDRVEVENGGPWWS